MLSGLVGSRANEQICRVGALSVSEAQLAPVSKVRQIPPPGEASKSVVVDRGSATSADTRAGIPVGPEGFHEKDVPVPNCAERAEPQRHKEHKVSKPQF